jgi:SNF2 family DNA or RNA helicase
MNNRLRSICFIRRTKGQVLKELPDKQQTDVILELDNRKVYNEARDDLVRWLKENAKLEQDFLDSICGASEAEQAAMTAEYRQTAAMRAARALQLTKIEHLKQLAAAGKLAMAKDWIKNFLDTGEKLIIFASHIDIQKTLIKEYPGCAHIIGEDSDSERQYNIVKFQDDEQCKVIICSLKAAGIGVTLTAASNVVFLELGWTPSDHEQGISRAHRMGQKSSVMAWYLLAKDSIDEDITELINEKRIVVDAATDGGGTAPEQSSIMNDLIKRLTK